MGHEKETFHTADLKKSFLFDVFRKYLSFFVKAVNRMQFNETLEDGSGNPL